MTKVTMTMQLSLTIHVVIMLFPMVTPQLTWQLLHAGNDSVAPAPRRDASLGYDAVRNRLILYGGSASMIMGDTWSYDLSSGRWREISTTIAPMARKSMVYGLSGNYFYVSTGEGPNKFFFNDIWRFDLVKEEWEELPSQSRPSYYSEQQWNMKMRDGVEPDYRYGSAGGIFPNSTSFSVSLGFAKKRYFDTFSYDTTNLCWTEEFSANHPYDPSYPHARCLHGGTMVSPSELVIFGGCLTGGGVGGPCPSGDSWMFNFRDKSWEQLPSCASPRMYPTMAMLPMKQGLRRAILYGGKEKSKQVIATVESPAEQVGVFNPDTKEWVLRQTEGDIPSKRQASVMATGSSGIYMFGGSAISGGLENDLYILLGDSMSADAAPQQADCKPTFVNMILLHGILMVLSWGFFLQWGAFIARYFRHKDPLWFHLHRLFQVFGLAISLGGVILGFLSASGHFRFAHSILGFIVTVFGLLQPINAILRPHKPMLGEVKSIRRMVWEFIHLNLGRLTLALAIVQCSMGVFLAVSHTAVWATWFGYVIFILLAYIIAEINKQCKDTSSYETRGTVNSHSAKSFKK